MAKTQSKKKTNTVEKVSLELINPTGLSNFITKFLAMDESKTVILMLNSEQLEIRALSPSEGVVKVGTIDFTELFTENEFEGTINLGILNADKFLKIFSYLKEDNINFTIKYTTDDMYAVAIELKANNIQKSYVCAPKSVKNILTDENVDTVFDLDDAILSFNFNESLLTKIHNLISLERTDYWTITLKDNALYFSGDEFTIKHDEAPEILSETDEISMSINKLYSNMFDKRTNYKAYLKEHGVIFISDDKTIRLGIGYEDNDVNSAEVYLMEDED